MGGSWQQIMTGPRALVGLAALVGGPVATRRGTTDARCGYPGHWCPCVASCVSDTPRRSSSLCLTRRRGRGLIGHRGDLWLNLTGRN